MATTPKENPEKGNPTADKDGKGNNKRILGVKIDRNEKGEATVNLSLTLIISSIIGLVGGTATLILFYTSFKQEVENVSGKIDSLSKTQNEMFDKSANNFKELEIAVQVLLDKAGSSRSLNLETLTFTPFTPVDTLKK